MQFNHLTSFQISRGFFLPNWNLEWFTVLFEMFSRTCNGTVFFSFVVRFRFVRFFLFILIFSFAGYVSTSIRFSNNKLKYSSYICTWVELHISHHRHSKLTSENHCCITETRRYGAYTSASWLWNLLIVNAEK